MILKIAKEREKNENMMRTVLMIQKSSLVREIGLKGIWAVKVEKAVETRRIVLRGNVERFNPFILFFSNKYILKAEIMFYFIMTYDYDPDRSIPYSANHECSHFILIPRSRLVLCNF